MTALTGDCPCAVRARVDGLFTDPTETPGPTENVVCVYCGKALRTNASSQARRVSWQDEAQDVPGEMGRITAARARAGLIRGRPFDNAPPIDPRPRPPWAPPGDPT